MFPKNPEPCKNCQKQKRRCVDDGSPLNWSCQHCRKTNKACSYNQLDTGTASTTINLYQMNSHGSDGTRSGQAAKDYDLLLEKARNEELTVDDLNFTGEFCLTHGSPHAHGDLDEQVRAYYESVQNLISEQAGIDNEQFVEDKFEALRRTAHEIAVYLDTIY